MLPLYLLAAHLVGDFVLQTRWQAAGKFTDRALRKRHVWAYAVPFVPLVSWRCWGGSAWHEQRGVVFICLLVLLHFATDSHRFRSTLGDVIGWQTMSLAERGREVELPPSPLVLDLPSGPFPALVQRTPVGPPRLPDNPWTPIPILIDQTLHVVQLAVLGGIFLS